MADDFDQDMFWPDEDDESDYWFPADFLGEDTDDDDIELLHNIQDVMGQSVKGIITDLAGLSAEGMAGNLRGVRFASGSEALIWLFRRGLFLYSRLVQFGDGTWGVAIGSSQGNAPSEEGDGDVTFGDTTPLI